MRVLIHGFIAFLCLTAPAFACEPTPEFPIPSDVANIQLIVSRHGELTEAEQQAFKTYTEDRERYMELYEQAYPCPLAAGPTFKRLRAENSEAMVEEMATLTAKWTRGESLPDQGAAPDDEEFIDVPDGEMLMVE